MLKNAIIALVSFLIPAAIFANREKRLNAHHRNAMRKVESETHTRAYHAGWEDGARNDSGGLWYHLTEEQQEFWRIMHPGHQDPWHKI